MCYFSESVLGWSLCLHYSIHSHPRHITMLPPALSDKPKWHDRDTWKSVANKDESVEKKGKMSCSEIWVERVWNYGGKSSQILDPQPGTQRRWACPHGWSDRTQKEGDVPDRGTLAKAFTRRNSEMDWTALEAQRISCWKQIQIRMERNNTQAQKVDSVLVTSYTPEGGQLSTPLLISVYKK